MSGFELLERMKASPHLSQIPVIVYTGRDLSKKQETELRRLAETIIIKDVKSPDRLLDETALFLHRVESSLPADKRKMLEHLHQHDPALAGRRALIVDDDIRNIFALTSVLEQHEVEVFYAENGKDGIKMLEETPGIDVVLMDVMMPEMDGYEAMRRIREQKSLRALPIIALTAKAMKGDREKCIEAGASDYITKPVDTEQLVLVVARMALPVKKPGDDPEHDAVETLELELILEAVFRQVRVRLPRVREDVDPAADPEHHQERGAADHQRAAGPDPPRPGHVGSVPARDLGQRQRDVPRSALLSGVPAARGAGAAHVSVHPHLAGRLLARRGGVLAGHSAAGGGALRPEPDLRDRHQRGDAPPGAGRDLPGRPDAEVPRRTTCWPAGSGRSRSTTPRDTSSR